MTAGTVSERVYQGIRELLSSRSLRPGERLDAAVLAGELSSSVTPVRDALHTLVGEGLVTSVVGEGFHVPHIDEPSLRDLYRWNLEVLLVAIRAWQAVPVVAVTGGGLSDDAATEIANVCAMIGELSGNAEHLAAIRRNNARLLPLRQAEALVLPRCLEEVFEIQADLEERSRDRLRRHLANYHHQRERKAATIIRALYRR